MVTFYDSGAASGNRRGPGAVGVAGSAQSGATEDAPSIDAALPASLGGKVRIPDVAELLCRRSVHDGGVAAAVVMLTTATSDLRTVASSASTPPLRQLFELLRAGPGDTCFQVDADCNHDFAPPVTRWSELAERARAQGFATSHCLPMHLEGQTIGVLGCFMVGGGHLSIHDAAVLQTMADLATIAICEAESSLQARNLNVQLAHALKSRVVIEQAKGIVSQSTQGSVDEAFVQIRRYARSHNLRLSAVATALCTGSLAGRTVLRANALLKKIS